MAGILVALVALTGAMFVSGDTTPRLGIDLAGGTSITLTAHNPPGQPNAINPTNMNTAVNIINRRVNGLGVTESEVQTQGSDNIVVNIPKGTNSDQAAKQVGTTARLYFRTVVTEAAGAPTPSPSSSPSTSPSGKATGKPSSGKGTTPSPSATTQGRAVTDALKNPGAGGKPATPSAPATPPTTPGTSSLASVPPAVQKQFAELDCTKPAQRSQAGANATATDTTVGCSQDGKAKYILGPSQVDGKDVTSAKAVFDTQQGSGWTVSLGFNSHGANRFTDVTSQLAKQQPPNNQFAIVLDNQVVSSPSVSQPITGGQAEIYGSFTQQSAEDLANVLSYGALPLSFSISDRTTVSPQLGGEQLQGGLIAGAVGLALVVLYLLAYYRGLSFVAVVSLIVSAVLTYTIMALLGRAIGFALNLPAVCGAIVAIGITADSFIVYFERIRDELRHGRSLAPSVQRAWPRARRTILVSDFVSFLAAAVLFIVSVGKVQGFAFTLGLTTLLDVVVVYLFTKPLMTLLARRKFYAQGHPWSGLNPKSLGVQAPLRRGRRPARPEAKEA
nr:protein translocase subunit SecD [Streptomyces sp. SID5468]